MTGSVALVGAGPGAADLLTLRAVRLMEEADVILHDRLVSRDVLSVAGVRPELIDVGKLPGRAEEIQQRIHRLMVSYARAGANVVRLKGGDPMVFGRAGEELVALAEDGIDATVVPGISSAIGLPATLGLPLTLRDVASGFAVITGHRRTGVADLGPYVAVDTLVVLMGIRHRVRLARGLIEAGRQATQPVAFIESGSTPEERVVVSDLASVAAGEVEVRSPAVWVIGDVVGAWEQHRAGVGEPASHELVSSRAAADVRRLAIGSSL